MVGRGEVWWADLPDGRRPALVLTRQLAIPLLSRLIIVPATRTTRGIPTEVQIGPGEGLPDRCVLSLDNVALLPKARLRTRICTLPADKMREVCKALAIATGCD